MVDFRKLMTPKQIMAVESHEREAERVAALADSWLAREVLRIAREARELTGIDGSRGLTYSSALTMRIVPFLARRLDGTVRTRPEEEFTFEEAARDRDRFLPLLPPKRIAEITVNCVSQSNFASLLQDPQLHAHRAIRLLDRHPDRLNPVIVLLSRACPELGVPVGEARAARAPLTGYHLVLRPRSGPTGESLLTYCPDMESARMIVADAVCGRASAAISEMRLQKFEGVDGLLLEVRDQQDRTVMGPVEWPPIHESQEPRP